MHFNFGLILSHKINLKKKNLDPFFHNSCMKGLNRLLGLPSFISATNVMSSHVRTSTSPRFVFFWNGPVTRRWRSGLILKSSRRTVLSNFHPTQLLPPLIFWLWCQTAPRCCRWKSCGGRWRVGLPVKPRCSRTGLWQFLDGFWTLSLVATG